MKHKARLTISRPSYGDGREKIHIEVMDEASRIRFLELEVELDVFTKVLTGRSEGGCDMTFRELENVGKVKESRDVITEMPAVTYQDRDEVAQRVCQVAVSQEDEEGGWKVSRYFVSKGSFFREDGVDWVRGRAYRWVTKEEEKK